MDDEVEPQKRHEQEKKIPIFRVLKNKSILKNIYLLDTEPSICVENGGDRSTLNHQEFEQVLVVGRHPDCNIRLEHPSISRFHLRIRSSPSSHKLSVSDLSSVHGTWVLGKKIEPRTEVELNEGDTMQLGASSRVYMLHWVPLSSAYNMEDPFIPPSDVTVFGSVEERQEDTHQNGNCLSAENYQVQSPSDDLQGLAVLFCDESLKSSVKKVKLSTPSVSENCSFSDEDREIRTPKVFEEQKSLRPALRSGASLQSKLLSLVKSKSSKVGTRNTTPLGGAYDLEDSFTPPLDVSLSVEEREEETHQEGNCLSIEKQQVQSPVDDFEGLALLFSYESSKSSMKKLNPYINSSISDQDKENHTPKVLQEQKSLRLASRSGARLEPKPLPLLKSNLSKLGTRDRVPLSGDYDLEDFFVLPLDASVSVEEREEEVHMDRNCLCVENIKIQSLGDDFQGLDLLFSDEHLKSSTRKANHSAISMPEFLNSPFYDGEKENWTPKVLQEQKSLRPPSSNRTRFEPDRVPLQYLLVDSTGKSNSKASVVSPTPRSVKSVTYPQTIEKKNGDRRENKRWTMVVDTACLLNKESRKELQLLQGLKGTQLIIPRIVIRELDCMMRRGSLLRRNREVYSALQWIEACMLNTKWWIHVQSSAEEGSLIAPTPPVSPLSRFSLENGGFPLGSVPFLARGSLLEIVSPTAEDHILQSSLFFRSTKHDGQLVLLSDDVTLKIKAMSEGLICETVEEFRQSLVNPFSDRFMWADSSPRGATWSYVDDVILREKYYPCLLKKLSKSREGAKGLKLLLLNNSHYRQISSVS